MTNEERKKYFTYYNGEDSYHSEWAGKAEGLIWAGERVVEENWERIKSGEWDKSFGYDPRPIEETIEDIIIGVAQKFSPWDWEEVVTLYESIKAQ